MKRTAHRYTKLEVDILREEFFAVAKFSQTQEKWVIPRYKMATIAKGFKRRTGKIRTLFALQQVISKSGFSVGAEKYAKTNGGTAVVDNQPKEGDAVFTPVSSPKPLSMKLKHYSPALDLFFFEDEHGKERILKEEKQ